MKRLALALVSALLVLPLVPAVAAEAASTSRATWVWNRPAVKTLITFAVRNKVTELFLSVPPAFATSADVAWVRSVATQAHANGIRVSALGGDPGWIDDPAAALAWQSSALSTGLFDGVHLDVEPWVRADWDSRQPEVVAAYVDVIGRLAAATSLPVEADLAFWLGQVTTADGTPLDRAVMQRVDRVTLMTYRNTATGPDSITALGAASLATATSLGKPCRFAVETRYLGSDPVSRKQTFHGFRASQLASALTTVDSYEASSPSYAGVAVHDYAGWAAMK